MAAPLYVAGAAEVARVPGLPGRVRERRRLRQREGLRPTVPGPYREAIAVLTRLAHDHGLQAFDRAAHRLLNAAEVAEVDGLLRTDAPLAGGMDEPPR